MSACKMDRSRLPDWQRDNQKFKGARTLEFYKKDSDLTPLINSMSEVDVTTEEYANTHDGRQRSISIPVVRQWSKVRPIIDYRVDLLWSLPRCSSSFVSPYLTSNRMEFGPGIPILNSHFRPEKCQGGENRKVKSEKRKTKPQVDREDTYMYLTPLISGVSEEDSPGIQFVNTANGRQSNTDRLDPDILTLETENDSADLLKHHDWTQGDGHHMAPEVNTGYVNVKGLGALQDTGSDLECYATCKMSERDPSPFGETRLPFCNNSTPSKPESLIEKINSAESQIKLQFKIAEVELEKKKLHLLGKLTRVRQEEERLNDPARPKNPIQLLKSPRSSPVPDEDEVFVRKKVIRSDRKRMRRLLEVEEISAKAEDIASAVHRVRYMSPFLETVVDANLDEDLESPDLVDVKVVMGDEGEVLIATDFKNSSLKAFSGVFSETKSRVLKFDNSPWGIAPISTNKTAITLPLSNILGIVRLTPNLTLIERLRTKKQYYGVAAVGTSIFVVTSPYSNPRSVDVIDYSGTLLQTVEVDTLLRQPSFICIAPSGCFIVSDLSRGLYVTLSPDFNLKSGSQLEEGQLTSTRGVTTSQDGAVFVVDYQQKKVKVFSKDGLFITDFLTSLDGLKYPYGVCFDVAGRCYVTDGGSVKIFSY